MIRYCGEFRLAIDSDFMLGLVNTGSSPIAFVRPIARKRQVAHEGDIERFAKQALIVRKMGGIDMHLGGAQIA